MSEPECHPHYIPAASDSSIKVYLYAASAIRRDYPEAGT
jgi:hypothetical protein